MVTVQVTVCGAKQFRRDGQKGEFEHEFDWAKPIAPRPAGQDRIRRA
jgi:hypothetical protein